MDIEHVLAREAIRYTVGIYNSAVDRGAYAELREVFTSDARMRVSGHSVFDGCQAIIAALSAGALSRNAFAAPNFQRHLIGNSMINVLDGISARSVHYVVVITELGLDHSGVYVDTFVKSGDRWLISMRTADLEWTRPDSRFGTFVKSAAPLPVKELDLKFLESSSG